MPDQIIATLIDRLLDGSITPEEKELLAQWVLHDSDEKDLHSMMAQAWRDFKPGESLPSEQADRILGTILHRVKEQEPTQPVAAPVHELPARQAPVRRM